MKAILKTNEIFYEPFNSNYFTYCPQFKLILLVGAVTKLPLNNVRSFGHLTIYFKLKLIYKLLLVIVHIV